jgi:hypothetical protein
MTATNEPKVPRRTLPWRICLFAVLILGVLFPATQARADEPIDTLLMTNGGRMRGTVMEEDPQKGTSIKLLDGTVKRLKPGEVKEVMYGGQEPGAAAVPPIAPLPPPPPPSAVQAPAGVLPALDDHPPTGKTAAAAGSRPGGGLITAGIVLLCGGAAVALIGFGVGQSDPGGGAIATMAVGGSIMVLGGILGIAGASVRSSSRAPASPGKVSIDPWLLPGRAGLRVTF